MASVAVELPFVAAHYGIPESTLTSLSRSPTTELVNQLLESLTSKAHEYDGLKSDKLRLEVELENAVRSNESKIKVLKNNVEKSLKEISQLRSKLQESGLSQCFVRDRVSPVGMYLSSILQRHRDPISKPKLLL
jgi:nucleoprotein TPR